MNPLVGKVCDQHANVSRRIGLSLKHKDSSQAARLKPRPVIGPHVEAESKFMLKSAMPASTLLLLKARPSASSVS